MEIEMKPDQPVSISRMDRKKNATRQKIIAAGMELFIREGFDAVTMEQIAEQADIAKGTLYNYFPIKEAILDAFMKNRFQQEDRAWIERLRPLEDTRAQMRLLFRELLAGVQRQPMIFEKYILYRMKILASFQQDDSQKSGLYRVIRDILEQGQKRGEIRVDLPVVILEDLFEVAFVEAAKLYYLNPRDFNLETTIEQCIDLFLNGVRPNDRR